MSSDRRTGGRQPANGLAESVVALVRANADMVHRVDQLAAIGFGLNDTDARALEIVSRLGPIQASQLARELGMTTGGATTVIDHLEEAGYARRRRGDEEDRRRVFIEVTDLTRRVEAEMFGKLIADNRRLVASYSKSDLAIIKDFLERSGAQLTANIERMTKRLP